MEEQVVYQVPMVVAGEEGSDDANSGNTIGKSDMLK